MVLLALCLKIFDGRRHTARVGEKVKLKEAGEGMKGRLPSPPASESPEMPVIKSGENGLRSLSPASGERGRGK